MNLNDMSYTDYIKEVAIVIANDIEEDINCDYTEKEKEEFIKELDEGIYYTLQEWIQTYLSDINGEIMIILADKLGFEY